MWKKKVTKSYVQPEGGISLSFGWLYMFLCFSQYLWSIPSKIPYNVPLSVQGPHAVVETRSHETLKSYHQETIPLVWTFTWGGSQQS